MPEWKKILGKEIRIRFNRSDLLKFSNLFNFFLVPMFEGL